MKRFRYHRIAILIGTMLLCGVGTVTIAAAQTDTDRDPAVTTDDSAISQALLTAAPHAVVRQATIVSRTGEVLKRGSGEWVCRFVGTNNDIPGCFDARYRAFLKARSQGKKPRVKASAWPTCCTG